MIHSAEHIAEYLISKSNPDEGGELLSNMKLQKLLYYCQGLYYAENKTPLFEDKIYAWQYGPVVPSVYHKYKTFNSNGISLINPTLKFQLTTPQLEMVDEVYNFFSQFSAIKLMNMTHSESPWKETSISAVISLEKLEEHFSRFITNRNE